jgi:hypothetical protein
MTVTILNRLKKTKQQVTVTDRLGVKHTGHVGWFDDDFFSIIDGNGDESLFSHIGIAYVFVPGGIEKRALYRSDRAATDKDAE